MHYFKKVAPMQYMILAAAILIHLLFLAVSYCGNQYLDTMPKGANGILKLTKQDLAHEKVIPIGEGFLYYPGIALDWPGIPNNLPEGSVISIGDDGNKKNDSRSPFGTALYKIHIDAPVTLFMEIPEIYSASQVWVNGESVLSNGSLRPYRPYIQTGLIQIPANGADIMIQSANFSHYYRGMVTPPVIGTPNAISRMIACKLLFYGVLCFFTLGTAAAFLAIWFKSKGTKLHLYYGLLCLFFVLHISSPFWVRIGIGIPQLFYIIIDSAWFFMVLSIMAVTHLITDNFVPKRLRKAFIGTGIFFSMLPFVFTWILFPLSVGLYKQCLEWGKVVLGLYCILCALWGAGGKRNGAWLLAGNAIFGIGLLTNQLPAKRFPPIYLGTQTEYSGFLLVLLFLLLMLCRHAYILTENEQFTNRLQHEIAHKTWHLQLLLNERKLFISSVAHDLKAPAAIIQTYIELIRTKHAPIDPEIIQYLDTIEQKAMQMQGQIQELQEFNREAAESEPAVTIDLNAFLRQLYEDTKPYADAIGIYYNLKLPMETVPLFCQASRLTRALENIILNATQYTPANGTITLWAVYQNGQALIAVQDSGQGIAPEHLPSVFDYRFSTQNQSDNIAGGTRGLGLYFAKLTIQELGGSITVASKLAKGSTFRILLPLQQNFK